MKKWTAVILAVAAVLSLSGCNLSMQKEDVNAEQYVEYAKSLMDANYHGDFTAYMELTGASEEDAQARYEGSVEVLASSLEGYYLIDARDETIRQEINGIARELYQKTNYTVENAVRDEETNLYSVSIRVDPLAILQDAEPEVNDYLDELNERMLNREFEDMTDAEYEKYYAEGIIEILKDNLAGMTYADPVYVTVTFSYDEETQTTYLNDEELARVAQKFLVV